MLPKPPETPPEQPLNAPPIPQKALTLSWNVNECKPLHGGGGAQQAVRVERVSAAARGRGQAGHPQEPAADLVGRCRLNR